MDGRKLEMISQSKKKKRRSKNNIFVNDNATTARDKKLIN
jgi:hypothetical protein